ncbi:MAG: invasion associated locus B family protein [Gemmatimonadota bacterium]|jgi:invasion protein IalB|nr:invasion associated locus B family protein [Gemmatimonadota bacterium]
MRTISLGAGALFLGALIAPSANAQSGLPGGANSLREVHGDWVVICSAQDGAKACVMQQELRVQQSGQLVLAVELQPKSGGAEGNLVLPFGLALARGTSIQVDEGSSTSLPFRTCLPVGCVASVNFDAATLGALRRGTSLNVSVTPDGGLPEMQWAASLQGFGSAYDRAAALLQ